MKSTIESRISAIERICQTEVGRNVGPLAEGATGELERSAWSIAKTPSASVVVLTGAYIPWAPPGAAETDGPPGAGILATGLRELGIPARLLTDPWCLPVVRAAGSAAGGSLDVDCSDGSDLAALVNTYTKLGVTHLVAVERMGPAIDGRVRNFRGEDVTPFTSPLDALMNERSWKTVGIGDGGNELGMGKLSRERVAAAVSEGAQIHCVTAADALIVAGVSNWGALALLIATALVRGVTVNELFDAPPSELHQRVVDACVTAGAVDGTVGRQIATVDGLPSEMHELVINQMLELSEEGQ
jgi:hypothetical protein